MKKNAEAEVETLGTTATEVAQTATAQPVSNTATVVTVAPKTITLSFEPAIYAKIQAHADADERSVALWLARFIRKPLSALPEVPSAE